MPLYEYHCRACDKSFEKLRRMQDADEGVKCPACESEETERRFSTFATSGCGTSRSGRFT